MKNYTLSLLSIFIMLFGFSFAQEEVSGCTYPDAINYDESATVNDGSCLVLDCGYDVDDVDFFEKENYADYGLYENRDIITETVKITRQNNRPLYNAATQIEYYDNNYDAAYEKYWFF